MCLAGLPVLKEIAPTVESMTESLINMTPLKPSPEEVRQTFESVLLLSSLDMLPTLILAFVRGIFLTRLVYFPAFLVVVVA